MDFLSNLSKEDKYNLHQAVMDKLFNLGFKIREINGELVENENRHLRVHLEKVIKEKDSLLKISKELETELYSL